MTKSRVLKWILSVLELLMVVFLGALGTVQFWIAVGVLLVLHVIGYYLSKKDRGLTWGNTLGIISAVIAFIPILNILVKVVTLVLLIYEAKTPEDNLAHNTIEG